MSKYFQRIIALIYVLVTIVSFLIVLEISGVPISDRTTLISILGWVLFCFCSSILLTPIYLFFSGKLRKPIREEEEILDRCFREVLQRADCQRRFRLMIEEENSCNALAMGNNIIAISKGMMAALTEEELNGVLAHELGHHQSKDCIAASAFVTASMLPGSVQAICFKIMKFLFKGLFRSRVWARSGNVLLGMAALLIVVDLSFKWHLITPTISLFLFIILFMSLNRLFNFLCLLVSRYTEYRQDAYAYQLGYGAGLRDALKKNALHDPQTVTSYYILMNSTHPVIYKRIRKLEQLLQGRT